MAFEDNEEFIFSVVVMPGEIAFDFDELDLTVVEITDNLSTTAAITPSVAAA